MLCECTVSNILPIFITIVFLWMTRLVIVRKVFKYLCKNVYKISRNLENARPKINFFILGESIVFVVVYI